MPVVVVATMTAKPESVDTVLLALFAVMATGLAIWVDMG